jgi:hypothetical protein
MTGRTLLALGTSLAVAAGATGGAVAASGAPAPSKVTIKERQTIKVKPNRYIQDGLRWDKDLYTVRSGGTLHLVDNIVDEGPHTVTIVRPKDLPRTAAQISHCKICETLGAAHGADPNSDAPPKFQFLENGVGQSTPPSVDRAGDSGLIGPGKKGEFVDLKVTAKKGSTLTFICLIHPWMQARIKVR